MNPMDDMLLLVALQTINEKFRALSTTTQIHTGTKRSFEGPSLVMPSATEKFAGISLQELIDIRYRSIITSTRFIDAWDLAAAALLNDNRALAPVVDPLRGVFPDFKFSAFNPPAVRRSLIQYLHLGSISSFGEIKTKVGTIEAVSKIARKTLAIGHRSITTSRGTWRLRSNSGRSMTDALAYRPALKSRASTEMSALYSHMNKSLVGQDLDGAIEIIFSVAASLGPAGEDALTKGFTVVSYVPPVETTHTVWSKARALVVDAQKNPLRELSDLLVPVIGSVVFIELFGNPYRAHLPTYTQEHADKDIRTINQLEDGVLNSMQIRDELRGPSEAQRLVEMQQLIQRI